MSTQLEATRRQMRERVVIVGASVAGVRAGQTLRREGFTGSLTVVGEEHSPPYRRPPLSKELLAGTIDREQVRLGGADDLDAEWLLGRRACALDLRRGDLLLDNGERLGFDGLVIATGAAPRRIPNPAGLDGVHVIRTAADCLALRLRLTSGRPRVVVVGAGFVGTEVASTCRSLGLEVAVVDPMPYPLAPLGPLVGRACADLHRDHGVGLHLGRHLAALEGHGRVESVRLSDDTSLDADVVVVAIGVCPTTRWLNNSGLRLDDGVVCDESLAALGQDRIVVAGDVARWPHRLFDGRFVRVEHWSNAVEQGVHAARTLLTGSAAAPAFVAVPSFWSDQFGVRLQSVGLPHLADSSAIVEGSLQERRFVALHTDRDRVVGAVAIDMPGALAATKARIMADAQIVDAVPRTVGV